MAIYSENEYFMRLVPPWLWQWWIRYEVIASARMMRKIENES